MTSAKDSLHLITGFRAAGHESEAQGNLPVRQRTEPHPTVEAIISDLKTELGSRPVEFPKDILRKYVETRNYYTHFTERLRDKCLVGGGMYWGPAESSCY